jgi:hypothetical protein
MPKEGAMSALALTLLAFEPVLLIASVLAVRLQTRRSLHDRPRLFSSRRRVVEACVVLLPLLLLAMSNTRAHQVDLGLYAGAIIGALAIELRLRALADHLVAHYLDPQHWRRARTRNDGWRFEMRYEFIERPEYVDELTLEMLRRHASLDAFLLAVSRDDFPEELRPLLRKRPWGFGLPTLRYVISEVIPNEVLRQSGPLVSGLTPAQAYRELRSLARGQDRVLLMDRVQFYWAIRNMNFQHRLIGRVLRLRVQLVVIGLPALIALAWAGHGHEVAGCLIVGASIGALQWLVIVTAGTSLLVVSLFRGTGTFSLPCPLEHRTYDPLWRRFIQLGIWVFATLFLVYGMGLPFVIDPRATQATAAIDGRFVIYALLSFSACVGVVLNHVFGTHQLMAASKQNALRRYSGGAQAARRTDALEYRHYLELRELREWPFTGLVISQSLLGIVVPILVQATLLITAFKK